MDLDDALETFIVECRELLEDMETALLGVEAGRRKRRDGQRHLSRRPHHQRAPAACSAWTTLWLSPMGWKVCWTSVRSGKRGPG
jgi:chemotaxis protein histidine kinase CheA